MNEEFYAVIKLVSGEEILSKVCAFEENNDVLLVLDHPVFFEIAYSNRLDTPIIKISPWINLTKETTFIINRDKVITINEITDTKLIKIHIKYVKEQTKLSNKSKLSPNMGYISSISKAKILLEKIYNSEPQFKTKDL